MSFKVQVGPHQVSIHQGQTVLVSEPDGQIKSPSDKGLYFFDTRVISNWAIYANGEPWDLLNGGAIAPYASRTYLTNKQIHTTDGITLDAMVGVADLRARGFLLAYKQTIIRAVEQVDTTMAHYAAQQDRLGSLDNALAASLGAVTLASERYERGLTDFLNVLDAQRAEFELEREYVIAQEAAAHHLVNLFKALGGGWEDHQSLPPIRQPQPAVIAAFRELLKPKDSKP